MFEIFLMEDVVGMRRNLFHTLENSQNDIYRN